jgi:hypothetical protein
MEDVVFWIMHRGSVGAKSVLEVEWFLQETGMLNGRVCVRIVSGS